MGNRIEQSDRGYRVGVELRRMSMNGLVTSAGGWNAIPLEGSSGLHTLPNGESILSRPDRDIEPDRVVVVLQRTPNPLRDFLVLPRVRERKTVARLESRSSLGSSVRKSLSGFITTTVWGGRFVTCLASSISCFTHFESREARVLQRTKMFWP